MAQRLFDKAIGYSGCTTPLISLNELNGARTLADESRPLALWLANAVAVSGARPEVAVFRAALAKLSGAEDRGGG